MFLRIFKREQELELWMKNGERFARFASYPVCRYSGELGPKLREGDYQAPEGFTRWGAASSIHIAPIAVPSILASPPLGRTAATCPGH